MNRIYLTTILFVTLLASACVPPTPVTDAPADNPSAPTVHELSITATGAGWDAPESAAAGWTAITLINQSEGMRQAAFLRLDDDKSMDDVFAAIEAGMDGVPARMTAHGGVSGVMPGETKAVTTNLPAGQYIVVDPVPRSGRRAGHGQGILYAVVSRSGRCHNFSACT